MSAPATEREVAATHCRLDIRGMDCGDCAKTIEVSLARMPGVASAAVNFGLGRAEVAFDEARVSRDALAQRVKALGYEVIAEPAAGAGHAVWLFDVTGMDCGDCAKTIEAGVRRLPGVAAATINFGAATLSVTPAGGRLSRGEVLAAVAEAGYQARPRGEATTAAEIPWWRTRRVVETALAALLWIVGFALEQAGVPRWASAAPFLAAMAVAGYPIARAALFAIKARRPDMNLLMTVAASGAIVIGRWDEGSSVLILFAIGLTLQTLTMERTRRAIQALMELTPQEATVIRGEHQLRIPVAEVAVGEAVIVLPGERIPIDGEVIEGHSLVDQAPITGESVPVALEPGSRAYAASINGDGALTIRSTKRADDTALARIIHLVEQAQGSRAPAQAFVDRFAAVYTPVVIGLAILLATVVPLAFGDWRDWFFRALVLLVVACPCALVISTPVALVAAIGSASRSGVLFKGGAAIEQLATIRRIALDKTGTLTSGRPAVTEVVPFGSHTSDEVLALAAAIERGSTHPIANGIVAAAAARGLAELETNREEAIPGKGVRAEIAGRVVLAGSPRLFGSLADPFLAELAAREQTGNTVVLVGSESELAGLIALADPVRPVSKPTIAALHALGLRCAMLTGDNQGTARRIAAAVGMDDVRAQLLPEDKVAAIRDLQTGGQVAMIGDGINDAPALAVADIGIAMGAGGTDVAIETADVALMGDDLAQLPVAVRLARRTMAIIRQNIAAALLVKAAFLLLTILGVTNLWLAVLADTGMSLLVTGNSLRLLRHTARSRNHVYDHDHDHAHPHPHPAAEPAGD